MCFFLKCPEQPWIYSCKVWAYSSLPLVSVSSYAPPSPIHVFLFWSSSVTEVTSFCPRESRDPLSHQILQQLKLWQEESSSFRSSHSIGLFGHVLFITCSEASGRGVSEVQAQALGTDLGTFCRQSQCSFTVQWIDLSFPIIYIPPVTAPRSLLQGSYNKLEAQPILSQTKSKIRCQTNK